MNNRTPPTRVLVTGLNWSGAGTVVGLLREYQGVVQVPGGRERTAPAGYKKLGEFNDFRMANLVGDQLFMKEELVNPEAMVNYALNRKKLTLSNLKELKDIRSVKQLREVVSNQRLLSKLNNSFERLAIDFKNHYDFNYRLKRAENWIDEITNISLKTCGEDGRAVVFDQPIILGMHRNIWPKIFKPFKLIIVFRDPRDTFAEQANKHYLFRKGMDSDILSLYGESYENALRYRVDVVMARMKIVDEILASKSKEEVLLISFEQMVNDYETSRSVIEDFVGLKRETHITQYLHFDPNWSKRNIGIHKTAKLDIPESILQPLIEWYEQKKKKFTY